MPPNPYTFKTNPILLLKTRSTPTDNYETHFSTTHTPAFIPVLSHNFHAPNLQSVTDLLTTQSLYPGSRKYGGIIFTSQRAVEGFGSILSSVHETVKAESSKSLFLYTVGPATAQSVTAIRDEHLPHATVLGAETGNGENLARYILRHYNSAYAGAETKPPLLFLVGEQRRDVIPKTLMAGSLDAAERIGVDELVIYETGVMEGFEEDFAHAVSASLKYLDGGGEKERAVWVVVFSPTGCDAMVRVLGSLDGGPARRVFVATIGPTTRDHLRNKYGFEADVCAEKPSQEGVGVGIQKFMEAWRKDLPKP